MTDVDLVGKRWWLGENGTRGQRLVSVIKKVRENTRWRRTQDLRHMRLYAGKNYVGFFTQDAIPSARDEARIRLNVLKAAVNTSQSYLAYSPRVIFLTDGGTQDDRIAAEQKQEAIDGVFYESQMTQKASLRQFHSLVFGTGFLYPYRDIETNTAKIDVPLPFEVAVSDYEAAYGRPMNFFRTRFVDTMQLASKFPGHKKAIIDAPQGGDDELELGRNWELDQKLVHWAWRAATPTTPGRHCIVLNDGTVLYDKPYHRQRVFFELPWTLPPSGYFGIGMCEEGAGLQTEINYLLQAIQRGLHTLGKSHWMIPEAAKIAPAQIGFDWVQAIRYAGMQPPVIYTPQVVPPEMYQHLWTLADRTFATLGVSQLASMMLKPAGINSGRALRTYNDMQSMRTKDFINRRDETDVELAEAIVEICQEIAEVAGEYKVKAIGEQSYKVVDWANIKDTEHVIRPWPASQLAQTPSGKIEDVQDLVQLGVAQSREDVIELLNWPDTKAFGERTLASRKLVQKLLEKMIREGQPWSPLPQMNLQEARDLATARWLQAVEEDVEPEKRDLLLAFIDECKAMIAAQNPQGAPPNAGPPGNPGPIPPDPAALAGGPPAGPLGPPL